jgi:hypothetical protein
MKNGVVFESLLTARGPGRVSLSLKVVLKK